MRVLSLLCPSGNVLGQVRGKWVGVPIGCKTAWCVWAHFRRAMVGTVYEQSSCWPTALSIETLSMSGRGLSHESVRDSCEGTWLNFGG